MKEIKKKNKNQNLITTISECPSPKHINTHVNIIPPVTSFGCRLYRILLLENQKIEKLLYILTVKAWGV
jgi:hypothetical protein